VSEWRRLWDLAGGAKPSEALRLYRLYVAGKLELRDPSPPRSWGEALARADYSLWLYALAGLAWAGALAALAGAPSPARLLAATLLVFFLPGYALVRLAYPRGGLRPVEELALSIAASLSIVPVVGLALNYTLGITLEASAVALAAASTTLGIAAHYRWWRSRG